MGNYYVVPNTYYVITYTLSPTCKQLTQLTPIHSNTGLYTPIKSNTQLYRATQRYRGIYTAIQIYTGLYTAIQGYTQLYRAINSYTGLYRDIQVFFIIILLCKSVYILENKLSVCLSYRFIHRYTEPYIATQTYT